MVIDVDVGRDRVLGDAPGRYFDPRLLFVFFDVLDDPRCVVGGCIVVVGAVVEMFPGAIALSFSGSFAVGHVWVLIQRLREGGSSDRVVFVERRGVVYRGIEV